jgi:hypothetical protein
VVINGEDQQEPPAMEMSGEPSESVIVSCGKLRLPSENEYFLELYASESVEGGEDNIYRAILADDAVDLGSRSTVLRWVHADSAVNANEGSELWGRVSAGERITLNRECRFERLSAPAIAFGEPMQLEMPPPEGEPLEPGDIPHVIDEDAGRWLVKGKLKVPGNRRVETNLVSTGEGHIGDGTHIAGSIKSHKDLHLGRCVVVEGSVVSGCNIHLAEGCRIKGPVLAEKTVFIERGCVLGSPDKPTTVSARRAEVALGTAAHGTFWAHEQGRLTDEVGKED